MPIRFRCLACGKLLGISRRKAGAIVTCPGCKIQLVVPNPEADPHLDTPGDKGTGEEKKLAHGAHLFERSDFEVLLQPEKTYRSPEQAVLPNPESEGRAFVGSGPTQPSPALPGTEGIYISPHRATWLSIAAVFALTLTFGLGILVGRFFRP